MKDTDLTLVTEWLCSGGTYRDFQDPLQWFKLLVCSETACSLDRVMAEKAEGEVEMTIERIMNILYNLICSR